MSKKSQNGDSYIHTFVKEGNIKGLLDLKKLNILASESVDSIDKKRETALSLAVRNNYPAVVNILLSSGADPNKTIEGGKTYLQIAIESQSRDALRALLENGLPVDLKGNDETPILSAVNIDDIKSMEILKEYGSDLKQEGIHRNTLLHEAALSGSNNALVWLLDNYHSVDEKNDEDFTPLHHAARYGKVSIVKELLSRKANVNAETIFKDTPLHWAAVNGNITVVQELILNGSDVNSKQINLWTPLHIAAYHGHFPVVKELLLKGAEVNALNEPKHTPLYYAIVKKHIDIADYIKSKGGISQ